MSRTDEVKFEAMSEQLEAAHRAASATIDPDAIGLPMGALPVPAHALTDTEREVCELMGIAPADYVRRRDAASAAEAVRVSGCPPRENESSGCCADGDAPSKRSPRGGLSGPL